MSKVEEYIKANTKKCSNLMQVPTLDDKGNIVQEAHPWLSPDEARRAVEIAREEIYEWLSYHIDTSKMDVDYKFEVIEELRKAMKDE